MLVYPLCVFAECIAYLGNLSQACKHSVQHDENDSTCTVFVVAVPVLLYSCTLYLLIQPFALYTVEGSGATQTFCTASIVAAFGLDSQVGWAEGQVVAGLLCIPL